MEPRVLDKYPVYPFWKAAPCELNMTSDFSPIEKRKSLEHPKNAPMRYFLNCRSWLGYIVIYYEQFNPSSIHYEVNERTITACGEVIWKACWCKKRSVTVGIMRESEKSEEQPTMKRHVPFVVPDRLQIIQLVWMMSQGHTVSRFQLYYGKVAWRCLEFTECLPFSVRCLL